MKSCPNCNRTYPDETLAFCLVDGSILSAPYDPHATISASAPASTEQSTEVLTPGKAPDIPASEKTLTALPLDFKPAVSATAEQERPDGASGFFHTSLGKVVSQTVTGAFLGALLLFAYSLLWLILNVGLTGSRVASSATSVLPVGAALGAISGLVIGVVLLVFRGRLANWQQAILVGGGLGTALVFIYRAVIGPCMGDSPPHVCLTIHFEHTTVAVIYGVSLGAMLGAVYTLNRKTNRFI